MLEVESVSVGDQVWPVSDCQFVHRVAVQPDLASARGWRSSLAQDSPVLPELVRPVA